MANTNRRSFLKLFGCASVTTPSLSFAKTVTKETNWHRGKIAKKAWDCGSSFKPGQVGRKGKRVPKKGYGFILTDEDDNGIVTFAPDALAHKKVVRHGFLIHKQLGDKKELLVEYRIDSKYVVHLRLRK